MSRPNLDKLNQIKMKYGYQTTNSHTQQTEERKKVQFSSLSWVDQDQPFSKIQMEERNNQKNSIVNTFNQKKNRSSSVKHPVNQHQPIMGIQGLDMNTSFGQIQMFSTRQFVTAKEPVLEKQRGTNFMESYEKTYDLLKNYRTKIRDNYQSQKEVKPQKKLNIKQAKQNSFLKQKNSKGRSIPSPVLNLQLKNSQGSNRQDPCKPLSSRKVLKQRRSPLQGIDTNIVDVKQEVDSIARLQDKIKSFLQRK